MNREASLEGEKGFRDFDWRVPRAFWLTTRDALIRPGDFFAQTPSWRGLTPPLAFLAISQAAPALIRLAGAFALGQADPAGAFFSFANSFGQSLIMALIIFVLARYIMKTTLRLETALRVYAYGGGIWVLSFFGAFLPGGTGVIFLGALTLVHLFLVYRGLQAAADLSWPLSAACLIIAFVVMMIGASLLSLPQSR